MEVLFLSHRIPYPPNKGDKIRSHAMISHLAKHHTVHLACFVDNKDDLAYLDVVRRIVGGECLFVPLSPTTKWIRAGSALLTGRPITTAYFGSPLIMRWVRSLMRTRSIDRTIVFSTAMAPYILDGSGFDPERVLFDMLDVDSDKWHQYAAAASLVERWIFQREATKLRQLERLAAEKFGVTTLVSPYEAASFTEMAPESAERICALSNGVDLEQYQPYPFPTPPHDGMQSTPNSFADPFPRGEIPIVMTGWMDYRPNSDGASWFATQVMPHVISSLPRARFYIVGANPGQSLRALARPEIVVTGKVEDVRPYIHHAAVAVAPLRMARGVQNKVLEAMAMQKPVVATPQATRALAVTTGVELFIASDPHQFAEAVVAAASGENRESVARNGRTYVERNHNWGQILAALDDMLARLGEKPTRPRNPIRSMSSGQRESRHDLDAKRTLVAGAER